MFKKIFLILSVFLLTGWGRTGHSIINKNAVQFFPTNFNFDWEQLIESHASDADSRKSSDPNEGPKHYIDIDSYQSFIDTNQIIQDYDSIVSVYGLNKVIDIGILPWAIINTTDSLQAAFENGNYDKAALIAADLGHYVADAHMPLHITKNYNGQYTNQYGVHSRYESTMIDKYSSQLNYASDSISFIDNISDYVFNMIYGNYKYVDSVLNADSKANTFAGNTNSDQYYQKLWELSGNFTLNLFNHASKTLAELIITAWINAGSPNSITNINDFIKRINNFQLYQNFPNPFNPATTIEYTISNFEEANSSSTKNVQLIIYDVLGRKIETLVNQPQMPGNYKIKFDGSHLSSGIYYYQIKYGSFVQIKKMILLK